MPTAPSMIGFSANSAGGGVVSSLSVTVNYPTGTTSGDLVLAFAYAGDFDGIPGGTVSAITATGWTAPKSEEVIRNRAAQVMYRIASGETSGTFTMNRSTSVSDQAGIQVVLVTYRGFDASNPINVVASAQGSGGFQSSLAAPRPTTTAADCAIVWFCGIADTATSGITWSAGTEQYDDGYDYGDRNSEISMATSTQASAGQTVANTATLSSAEDSSVWTVAIAPQTNLALSASDTTGTTADTAKVTADPKPTGDAASGTEAAVQRIALKRDPDTATATETEKVTALVQPTGDTGSAAPETEKVTALIRPDSDTATATETAVARFTARGDDAITAVDTEKLTADADLTETIGSTDTEKVAADIRPTGETITLVGEDARATYSAKGDDTAQADDTATSVGSRALQADTAAGTETHKVTATAPPATDTASATESASTDSEATASDASSPAAETQRLTIRVSDTATATDSARVQAVWTVTDTSTASDAAGIWLNPDGDTGSGTDSSFKSISGILDTPRLLTVPKDVRRFVVEKEVRRVMVAYDLRRIAIGKDLAPRSKMPHKDSRTLGILAEERIFIAEREE